jgi:hypothetical protein
MDRRLRSGRFVVIWPVGRLAPLAIADYDGFVGGTAAPAERSGRGDAERARGTTAPEPALASSS